MHRASETRDGFEAHLARIREERDAKIAAIGGSGNGVELMNESGTRFALLLPDCSELGMWRIQWFSQVGFFGHALFPSEDALLEAAVGQGFTARADGSLDRFAQMPSFERGNFAADLIWRVNCGEINLAQANAVMASYDEERNKK